MYTVKISILILSLFVATANAKPLRNVEVYSPDYPKDAFKNVPNTNVTFHSPYKSKQTMPKIEIRNKHFAEIPGLPEKIQFWPEMEKDLLYMKARHLSLEQLKKDFKTVSEKQLAQLKKVVQ